MSYTPKPSKKHPGWVEVPGYPYFLANKQGKVRNANTGYVTFGSLDDKGYRRVCQWDNDSKTKKEYKAHHIVCTAFHGPCPSSKHEVGHKDDDRSNNAPSNLQWITRKDNMTKANKKRVSTESSNNLKATLILGNPKYIRSNPAAKAYYQEIVDYLESSGCTVTVDAGEPYTCPPMSDLYIGHSRGAGRYRCVEDDPEASWRFLKFGDIDGVMHPKDRAYQVKYDGSFGTKKTIPDPPKEHYMFIDEQKKAIDDLLKEIRSGRVSMESSFVESIYVARYLTETSQVMLKDMQKRLGLENPIPVEELHLTLMYSPDVGVSNYTPAKRPLVSNGPWELEHLGDDQRTVAIIIRGDEALQKRHSELLGMGAEHTYTPYMAHVSLSYDDHVSDEVAKKIKWNVDRKLTFIKEYAEPIEDEVSVEEQVPEKAPMSLNW